MPLSKWQLLTGGAPCVQLVIHDLPISAAFRYAIYTHDFIMVRAFPVVGAPPSLPSFAPLSTAAAALEAVEPAFLGGLRGASADLSTLRHGEDATRAEANSALRTAGADLGSRSSAHQDGRAQLEVSIGHMVLAVADAIPAGGLTQAHADDADSAGATAREESLPMISEPIRRAGDALLEGWEDAWRRWKPLEHPVVAGALAPGGGDGGGDEDGEKCPNSSTALNVTDAEVQADSHMATLFVNDAVPQCLLWALHRRELLTYTVQDGQVPGVRLTPPPPPLAPRPFPPLTTYL